MNNRLHLVEFELRRTRFYGFGNLKYATHGYVDPINLKLTQRYSSGPIFKGNKVTKIIVPGELM